jgi:hypothetical protein
MLTFEDFKQTVLEEALGFDSGDTIVNEALQDHVKDKFDTVSWNVNKQEDGSFKWTISGVKYKQPNVTLEDGTEPTRAKAVGKAKKAVMKYRKSVKEVAVERDAE